MTVDNHEPIETFASENVTRDTVPAIGSENVDCPSMASASSSARVPFAPSDTIPLFAEQPRDQHG